MNQLNVPGRPSNIGSGAQGLSSALLGSQRQLAGGLWGLLVSALAAAGRWAGTLAGLSGSMMLTGSGGFVPWQKRTEASWRVFARQGNLACSDADTTTASFYHLLLAAAGDATPGAPPAAQAEAPPADLGSILANVGSLLGVNGLQMPASNGQSDQQSGVDWGIMLNQMPPVGGA